MLVPVPSTEMYHVSDFLILLLLNDVNQVFTCAVSYSSFSILCLRESHR